MMILMTIFIPIILGILLLLPIKTKAGKDTPEELKFLSIYTGVSLVAAFILTVVTVFGGFNGKTDLITITDVIVISFNPDRIGGFFAVVMSVVWTLVGFYSFEYIKHVNNNRRRFFGIYLLVLGILMGLCFSGNLVTYYAFYELMTLGSFAMVLHGQDHEAVMAGLKYMFYSFAGAYMVLFGIYFVYKYSVDPLMNFTKGGIIDVSAATAAGALKMAGDTPAGGVLMASLLLMIVGFSVKAGMFPMHGWLPTAHPVAPAPASAVLSAIIVKSGVLGIIRVIFYIFGDELFDGTYVQTVVLILSLTTVFAGSMLAYKEKVFKKRLAYSTVSQVSYILFGIFVMNSTAFYGSEIHVAAHAAIKSVLFMCAGAVIYLTGCTKVDELRGIGKKMPVMLWCYTIAALGLIGIPPFGGFASKWYLCVGSLDKGIPVFGWLGPVVLLVSALLTAGYLLPITINGFLPGKDFMKEAEANPEDGQYKAYLKIKEPSLLMLVPIIILTILSVLIGLLPEVMIWA